MTKKNEASKVPVELTELKTAFEMAIQAVSTLSLQERIQFLEMFENDTLFNSLAQEHANDPDWAVLFTEINTWLTIEKSKIEQEQTQSPIESKPAFIALTNQSIAEQLPELKTAWLTKPTFKLEEFPGFEAHKEELLQYRLAWSENDEVKDRQRFFIDQIKEQWQNDSDFKGIAFNDPEFNLFTDELQFISDTVVLEANVKKLEEFKAQFEKVKAENENLNSFETRKNWDRYLDNIAKSTASVELKLKGTPGLDEFITEVYQWVDVQKALMASMDYKRRFKSVCNYSADELTALDVIAVEAMRSVLPSIKIQSENYAYVARVSYDIAEAFIKEKIEREEKLKREASK